MDQDILVEPKFEDGTEVIRQLEREQFGVAAAFWAKTSDDGLWQFWIASPAVNSAHTGDALKIVYRVLGKLPGTTITPADIRLIINSDPIARDVIALRDRYPSRKRTRFHGMRLGHVATVDLCIYPKQLPWDIRELSEGHWEVLVSEREDDQWLTCDSEADARAIASAPVLKYEALARVRTGRQFVAELEKTADVMGKYRLGFGSRFLRGLAQQITERETISQGAA